MTNTSEHQQPIDWATFGELTEAEHQALNDGLEWFPVIDGSEYHETGKRGRNIATGRAVAEYENGHFHRVWMDAERNIYPD